MEEGIIDNVVDLALKATPPLTVTGLSFYGFTLPDVVAGLTIVYLVIHIGYILNKWIRGR